MKKKHKYITTQNKDNQDFLSLVASTKGKSIPVAFSLFCNKVDMKKFNYM